MKPRLLTATAVTLLLSIALLTGCTNDPLAQQYADGSGQGYITADGAYTELPVEARDEPIVFSGTDVEGGAVSSEDYAGQVYVVNFWYAGCPPCRAEAPDLAALSTEYSEVPFLGVNITDSEDVARTFEQKYDITYPSIIDARDSAVQLAFAGSVAPNAVPTTLVVDREGRVAARISGLIRDPSILSSMIDTVLAEEK